MAKRKRKKSKPAGSKGKAKASAHQKAAAVRIQPSSRSHGDGRTKKSGTKVQASAQRSRSAKKSPKKGNARKSGKGPAGKFKTLKSPGRTSQRSYRRSAEFKRKSEAAKKGWKTRRKNQRKRKKREITPSPKEKNQEYIIAVKYNKSRKKVRFDLFVIFVKDKTDEEIFKFVESWLRKNRKNDRWRLAIIKKSNPIIARGPLTNQSWIVQVR